MQWKQHYMFFCVLGEYKKITSYPQDGCVPGGRKAEGRGGKAGQKDLNRGLGHGQMEEVTRVSTR